MVNGGITSHTKTFAEHCASKHNTIIYESALFNSQNQEPSDSVESFLSAVHALANYCKFRDLREQLIRVIVVIQDAKQSRWQGTSTSYRESPKKGQGQSKKKGRQKTQWRAR